MKKRLIANKKPLIAVLLLAPLLGGFTYKHYAGSALSTENAYVNADVVKVSSSASGRVATVYIGDNQLVHSRRMSSTAPGGSL